MFVFVSNSLQVFLNTILTYAGWCNFNPLKPEGGAGVGAGRVGESLI